MLCNCSSYLGCWSYCFFGFDADVVFVAGVDVVIVVVVVLLVVVVVVVVVFALIVLFIGFVVVVVILCCNRCRCSCIWRVCCVL